MERKYEMIDETIKIGDTVLHRIKALKNFGFVKKGTIGGFIENESNLSHYGKCWVYGTARVSDNAKVYGNARIFGNSWVSGNAKVYGNARIFGNSWVSGNARVFDRARVSGNAKVYDDANVYDDAMVYGNAEVAGNAKVYDDAKIFGNATILSNDDIMTFTNIGYGDIVTVFKCRDDEIVANSKNHFNLMIIDDDIKDKLINILNSDQRIEEYLLVLKLAKLHILGHDNTELECHNKNIKVLYNWDNMSVRQLENVLDVIRLGYSDIINYGDPVRGVRAWYLETGKKVGGYGSDIEREILNCHDLLTYFKPTISKSSHYTEIMKLIELSFAVFLYASTDDIINIYKYRNYDMNPCYVTDYNIVRINFVELLEITPEDVESLTCGGLKQIVLCIYK